MKSHFVILFPERSGSTMLVTMLNSHPEIKCEFEFFAREYQGDNVVLRVGGEHMDINAKDVGVIIDRKLKNLFKPQEKLRGFKFKYFPDHIHYYPQVLKFLLSQSKKIKVIFLNRRNTIRAVISHLNHERLRNDHGVSNIFDHRKKIQFINDKFNIDIEWMDKYLLERESKYNLYRELMSSFDSVLYLDYEDLHFDYKNVCKTVLNFLEVDQQITLLAKTKKISTVDNLKASIVNYEDVEKYAELKGVRLS